ncbi:cation:proton antiporter [Rhodobacteraceae bacterium N5(2021)]|uniref:Cation:proton antiporter n=1 Tax=Gymnodinialimonas phycosphaerae TaxID=2841589 RepID=A0A975TY16_9RHOB|nr:cation:proton antiporter [Gymnodinialimonas phycosphaerae]MBY4893100.1 cation:proton antiporter [Gymnodinialimonas phycosphaerae]
MEATLLQITIYLGAMLVAVPISIRFGLGSVLGYLLAGIAIGPVLGLVGSETQDLQHYAEFGVVLMLFLIGLELDPRTLWDMRKRLLGLGGSQILLSILVLTGGAMLLGLNGPLALAIGMTLALSSTAIVLTTLTEKGLMRTTGGRGAFSVLLTQDIAVIPALALLPLLATASPVRFTEDGSIERAGEDAHHSISLVEGLPAWGVTLVTLAAVAAVILAGRYLSPLVFRIIHNAKLKELYTVAALAFVVSIAVLMILVGLSPALGAFLAGVVLANSEFKHELEADIEPFKGLLLGLFFITVGAGINFATLFSNPFLIIGLTLAIMLIKGAVLYGIARVTRMKARDRWLFTLGLAQAGEFGFVLVAFGVSQAVFPDFIAEILLLVVALSMLLTPLSFILFEKIGAHVADGFEEAPQHDEIDEEAPIIIAGVGRFGQSVNRMVRASGFKTVVLDSNLETIQLMRRFGLKSFFGDPTRPELLKAAGLDKARVLVVCVDDKQSAIKLVRYAKRNRPDISVVARAHDLLHVYELYEAGADHIIREVFDSSLRAARYVLEDMGLSDYEAHAMETAFYRHDRQNLRALAEVWKPGVPVTENAEYMRLTREMTDNLESAILTQLDQMQDEAAGARTPKRARGDVGALSGISRKTERPPAKAPRRPGGAR